MEYIEIRVCGCPNKNEALRILERLTIDDAGDRWVKTKPAWFEDSSVMEVILERKRQGKSDPVTPGYNFFSI